VAQLRFGSERTTNESYRKAIRLEPLKQAEKISSGLQNNKNWNLWRGRRPPKRKKRLQAEEE
jgi:hypothetical protein